MTRADVGRRAPPRPRGFAGFTMIEMTTALTVSLLILYAAVASTMALERSMVQHKAAAIADSDAKVVIEHITRRLRQVGGYGLPVDEAVAYEPAGCLARNGMPACGQQDRLTLIEPDPDVGVDTMTLTSVNPLGGNMFTIEAPFACGPHPHNMCCFDRVPGASGTVALRYRQVYLRGDDGSRRLGFVTDNANVSTCTHTVFSDPSAFHSNFFVPSTPPPVPTFTLTVVKKSSIFVNNATQRLVAHHDWNLNGINDDNDTDVLAINVQDFQVAVGIDVDGDNDITDDGSANDEWLGNHPSDALGSGGLAGGSMDQMRMVGVGVVIGSSSPFLEGARSATILDSPGVAVSRMTLRAALGYASFRNLDIFY